MKKAYLVPLLQSTRYAKSTIIFLADRYYLPSPVVSALVVLGFGPRKFVVP
jgi:hypothetical protein